MVKNLIKKAFLVCCTMIAMQSNEAMAQLTPQNYYQASSNGAANAVFNSDYHTRMQHLYLPSDFLTLPTAGNINKIYMRASSSRTNATFYNLVVRMGTTTATQLTNSAWSNAGLDTVFFKTTHIFPQISSNQWFEIDLDVPFYWDGTSNLIVDIAQHPFSGGFVLQFNNPGGSPAPRTKYGPKNGNAFLNNFPPVFFGYDGCSFPQIDLGNDTTICAGSLLILDAGNNGNNISWNTNDTTQTIEVNAAGQYIVTVGTESCMSTDSINVMVNELPSADAINFTYNGTAYDFSIQNGNNIESYLWNFGDGNTDTLANPTHIYDTSGDYNITLVIYNECGSDTLTTKVIAPVGIESINLQNALSIYPNPSTGIFNIDIKMQDLKIEQLNITNIMGQTMYSNIAPNNKTIEVSHLSSGIYTLSIKTNKGNFTQKIKIHK